MQKAAQKRCSVYRVTCQIFQAGRCVTDQSSEVGVGQETCFGAPDFVAKLTILGSSNEIINFTAALESGYRYVTPDLEVSNGGTSVLDFYGSTSRITVTRVDGDVGV